MRNLHPLNAKDLGCGLEEAEVPAKASEGARRLAVEGEGQSEAKATAITTTPMLQEGDGSARHTSRVSI